MQIHELTQPKKTKLDEANPLAAVTGAVGSAVAGAKNVGTAIASPFKNAGAAYSNQQSTAKINSWADRAYRTWEGYVQKRLLPMDPAQKSSYTSGQDGKMKQDLLSFVQKVFFGNLDMNNITNHQEVMGVIDSMLPGATQPTTSQTTTSQPTTSQPTTPTAAGAPTQPVAKPTTPTAPTTNPAGAIAQQRQQKLGVAAKVVQGQMAANPGPRVPQSPEEIRKAKQATAAQAAQDQMAGKPPVTAAATTPNFGAQTPGYGPVTSNMPSAIPSTNTKLPTNMGAGAKATPVTPVAKVPKVTSGGPTPDERAAYDAKLKAALAKQNQQTVTEAVDKPGFLKLAQLAATAQQPTGQKQGQYNVAANTPPAGIGPIMKQAGINPAILQTLGQLTITSLAKKNNAARKTGNPAADALLTSLGFTLA